VFLPPHAHSYLFRHHARLHVEIHNRRISFFAVDRMPVVGKCRGTDDPLVRPTGKYSGVYSTESFLSTERSNDSSRALAFGRGSFDLLMVTVPRRAPRRRPGLATAYADGSAAFNRHAIHKIEADVTRS